MKQQPFWALLPVAAIAVAAGAGSPVSAQVSETYTPWKVMHANANPPGVPSLQAQCLRSTALSGWTARDCTELAEAGTYDTVQVPDGTKCSALTGANRSVSKNKEQQLGGNTSARMFKLSTGKVAYWYTGFVGACNNFCSVPTSSTTILSGQSVIDAPGVSVYIPEQHWPRGCWCGHDHSRNGFGSDFTERTPGQYINIPGSTMIPSGGWTEEGTK